MRKSVPYTHISPVTSKRHGKVLALFALLLPVLLAVAGLVLDGGGLMNDYSVAQHAADAAATAAAKSLQNGGSPTEAAAIARDLVRDENGLSAATVTASIPPSAGPFTGDARAVEIEIVKPSPRNFLRFMGHTETPKVRTRAVARYEPSTAGAVLVVLDPDPPPLALPLVPGVLGPLPALIGGLEIIGTARVWVDGAVHVNTEWGGVDQNGDPAGSGPPPPSAIACLDLTWGSKLMARDIRVVGGVDRTSNYGNFVSGEPNPLKAGRLPVPDPLKNVPVPTFAADSTNVSGTLRGGVRIADLLFLSPPRTLLPGVYEWIEIVSGRVTFSPGVYIIRSRNPITQISLNILGGTITADGVMFYITDSAAYSPAGGAPDAGDGETTPPAPGVLTLLPSVAINSLLPGNTFRGLNDPSSPFDGILIYQRRFDRRPIAIVNGLLWGSNDVDGTIYSKWGHVILAGSSFGSTRVVAGTIRLIPILPSVMEPSVLLPPAEDVFLVE